jgi:hypothetical protein
VVAAIAAPEKARPAVTGAANKAFQNNLDIYFLLNTFLEGQFYQLGAGCCP